MRLLGRRFTFTALFLVACGSASNGAPAEQSRRAAVAPDPALVPDELRCATDDDCVATQFSDCCADRDGRCPCEWHAQSRSDLERRQLECGVEECADGSCASACSESEPPGPARCVDGYCQLPGGG